MLRRGSRGISIAPHNPARLINVVPAILDLHGGQAVEKWTGSVKQGLNRDLSVNVYVTALAIDSHQRQTVGKSTHDFEGSGNCLFPGSVDERPRTFFLPDHCKTIVEVFCLVKLERNDDLPLLVDVAPQPTFLDRRKPLRETPRVLERAGNHKPARGIDVPPIPVPFNRGQTFGERSPTSPIPGPINYESSSFIDISGAMLLLHVSQPAGEVRGRVKLKIDRHPSSMVNETALPVDDHCGQTVVKGPTVDFHKPWLNREISSLVNVAPLFVDLHPRKFIGEAVGIVKPGRNHEHPLPVYVTPFSLHVHREKTAVGPAVDYDLAARRYKERQEGGNGNDLE